MANSLDALYPGRVTPGDANYPGGSIKNETTPGSSNDGTPLDKEWANDREGFFQGILLEAGIVPNETTDTALSSQLLEAAKKVFSTAPVFTVITASDAAWEPNPLTKFIEFIVVGGGAGGGAVDGGGGSASFATSGSGAGWSIKTTNIIDATYNITIGAAGVGGAAGINDGTDGGTTTIVSASINVTAIGGIKGIGTGSSSGTTSSGGVLGGSSSGGDINQNGGWSTDAIQVAGSVVSKSRSGASYFGGGNEASEVTSAGTNATNYGEGGSSASSQNDATDRAGGDGFQGVVLVREYL